MLPILIIAHVGLAASLSLLPASDSNRSWRQYVDDPTSWRQHIDDPTTSCTKYQLPSLLFIGTGHSGSTSLAELINLHRYIKYGARKEHRFFTCSPPNEPYDQCAHNWQEYVASFMVDCEVTHTFDATANYYSMALPTDLQRKVQLHHNPGLPAVQEVYAGLPDVKILLIIRDPVDTMWSEGITTVEGMYWNDLPCIADAVETWLKVFPAWRFRVLRAEDAFNDMVKAANEVFDFMGLGPWNFTDHQLDTFLQSGRRRSERKAPWALRKEYFSQHWVMECKRRLQELTGLWFPWEGSQ